jgi:cephalosporin hydroxylase
MTDQLVKFYQERKERIQKQGSDEVLLAKASDFLKETLKSDYSYNFSWLGRPVIQYPEDLIALQEIIWDVKPRLIIETGVAHGGTAIFFASMLELLGGDGQVLSIDIDIRPYNRPLIEQHPMAKRVRLLESSSLSPQAFSEAEKLAGQGGPVMVVLDSSHTHQHVLDELRFYSKLVTKGSYLAVYDGLIELYPEETSKNSRPWGPGNNPLTAIREFLKECPDFEIDWPILNKLLVTAAPEGYLRRIK